MKRNILIAVSIAAAFAIPLSAGAAGDKSASASSGNAGAEKMFQSLDKNKDGFLSKDEVKGTPHEKEFTTLDKNHDGKLSREEHAAAPEHAGGGSGGMGATSGAPTSGTQSKGMKKY
jgi:EF hand domain-containing protein